MGNVVRSSDKGGEGAMRVDESVASRGRKYNKTPSTSQGSSTSGDHVAPDTIELPIFFSLFFLRKILGRPMHCRGAE